MSPLSNKREMVVPEFVFYRCSLNIHLEEEQNLKVNSIEGVACEIKQSKDRQIFFLHVESDVFRNIKECSGSSVAGMKTRLERI